MNQAKDIISGLSLDELEKLKTHICDLINQKKSHIFAEKYEKAQDEFFNLWFASVDEANEKIDLEKAYYNVPVESRWFYDDDVDIEYGEYPPCGVPDVCWWRWNQDRAREYGGDVYRSLLSDDLVICDNCFSNDNEHYLEEDINFSDWESDYLEWKRKKKSKTI